MQDSELVIRRLYDITSRYEEGLASQTRELLALGCERFGLEIGILAQVENDVYRVVQVVAPADLALTCGLEFQLGNTYCAETLRTNGPLACPHVGVSDLSTHPAYREFRLESYIGVPLVVGGRVYGTLNFSSPQPRERQFRDRDIDALQLMSTWIASELDRFQKEQALETARQDALTAVEQRDRFLAILSHELRNPLAVIHHAVTLAVREEASRPDALSVISRQTEHMRRLLEDLLDVTRVTCGKITIRKKRFDLNVLADEVFRSTMACNRHRDQEMIFEPYTCPLWLKADGPRVAQILENLLTNAMKYTPREGQIRLVVTRDSDDAVIRVYDTGCGMSEEMLTKAFDMFVQTDGSLHRSEGGVGIGLTLVKELVALHGGTVSALSKGLGLGSEFAVRLPGLCEMPAEGGKAAALDSKPPANVKVVLVEDNVDSRDMLTSLLELEGIDVGVAHDGLQGVELILTQRPQVAIVDVGLPGLDGYEVARRVRRELGQQIRLVALTGYGRTEDLQRSADAGFDLHLTKPVQITSKTFERR